MATPRLIPGDDAGSLPPGVDEVFEGYRSVVEPHSTGSAFVTGDSARFQRLDLVADGVVAAHVRQEFGIWLTRNFALDEDRVNDMVMGVNEALANAADYAYPPDEQPGTVDVSAVVAADGDALTVTVADHGQWREPAPQNSRRRGRGIPLMHALADVTSIDGSANGTKVTLVWRNVTRPPTQ